MVESLVQLGAPTILQSGEGMECHEANEFNCRDSFEDWLKIQAEGWIRKAPG